MIPTPGSLSSGTPAKPDRVGLVDSIAGDRRELRTGAARAFGVRASGSILQFVLSMLIARRLGPDGSGGYFLALTGAMIAAAVGRVGLDTAIVRFIAANAAVREWGVVRGVYRTALSIAVPASLALSVVLWAIAPAIAGGLLHKPGVGPLMRWATLAVLPLVVMTIHGEALKALKRVVQSQVVLTVVAPLFTIVLLVTASARSGTAVVNAYVGGVCGAAVVGIGLWHRWSASESAGALTAPRRLLLEAGLPVLGMAVMEFLLFWTGTVALGLWSTAAAVGVFGIATRIAGIPSYVLMAANVVLAPKFAELYFRGERVRLESVARHGAIVCAALAFPVVVTLLAVPSVVLSAFGHGFEVGANALRLVALGQFVNVATGSVGYLLVMTGHEKAMRNAMAMALAANVSLNCALVPTMGLLGAAMANASSTILQNVLAVLMVRRTLRIGMIRAAPRAAS